MDFEVLQGKFAHVIDLQDGFEYMIAGEYQGGIEYDKNNTDY